MRATPSIARAAAGRASTTRCARSASSALYTHQAEAINRLRAGLHTSSRPARRRARRSRTTSRCSRPSSTGSVALYLSPTKALAQDQLRQIARFELDEVRAETYDGDTPTGGRARRSGGRRTSSSRTRTCCTSGSFRTTSCGRRFLQQARVRRRGRSARPARHLRLPRRARAPASAPRRGALRLRSDVRVRVGDDRQPGEARVASSSACRVGAVTDDGSPTGERHFAFWNPPFLTDADDGKRRSSNVEAAKLLAELVDNESRTLAFSKSRVAAELRREVRAGFDTEGRRDRIVAYRAGYLADERRDIEQGLQNGRYPGVSATDALELGIDVGGLDAVVLNGFPGTVASARQQAGRAGRAGQSVARGGRPARRAARPVLRRTPERLLREAARSRAREPDEPERPRPPRRLRGLRAPAHRRDRRRRDRRRRARRRSPRRCSSAATCRERRGRLLLGASASAGAGRRHPLDRRRAVPHRRARHRTPHRHRRRRHARSRPSHPGSGLPPPGRHATASTTSSSKTASRSSRRTARRSTRRRRPTPIVVVLATEREGRLGRCGLFHGLVEVTDQVIGYQRKKLPGGEVHRDRRTRPAAAAARHARRLVHAARTSAARRAARVSRPRWTCCSAPCTPPSTPGSASSRCSRCATAGTSAACRRTGTRDADCPTIFIYDGYPMGAGISDHAFDVAREHLTATRDHLERCPCAAGCPACVQSPKCGNWNEPLHKAGAIRVLDLLLSATG